MLKRHRIDQRAADLASRQHGLISARQALTLGLKRAAIFRRIQSGRWRCLRRGVYCIAGSAKTRHRDIMEACLAGGPGACASGVTAAELYGFEEVWKRTRPRVSVPHRIKRRPRAANMHRAVRLGPAVVRTLDGIPVTTPARTIVDLAGVLPENSLELTIMGALRSKILSLEELVAEVGSYRGSGRRGFGKLRRILQSGILDSYHESPLEARTLQVIAQAGFPIPTSCYLVEEQDRRLAEVDFAFEDYKIAVQCDGAIIHGTRQRKAIDEEQNRDLEAAGWIVLRFQSPDVRRRAPVIEKLADAFAKRGAIDVLRALSSVVTLRRRRNRWRARSGRGPPAETSAVGALHG